MSGPTTPASACPDVTPKVAIATAMASWKVVARSGERERRGALVDRPTARPHPGRTPGAATVSHHLEVLTEAGLLTRERRSPWAWFTLVPERMAQVGQIFAS